jgi:hypothetical protein
MFMPRPHLMPFAAFVAYMLPLGGAICLSFLRLQDHSHNFRQLVTGLIIGILAGVFSWVRHRAYATTAFVLPNEFHSRPSGASLHTQQIGGDVAPPVNLSPTVHSVQPSPFFLEPAI